MELEHPKQIVNSALQLFKSIQHFEYLNNQLSLLDKELVDLNHYAEFNKLDVQRGYKVYKSIHDVNCKRRLVKNELELFEQISQFCKSNPDLKSNLMKISDNLNGIQQKIDNREYTARVRHDLFPKSEVAQSAPSLDSMISKMRQDSKKRKKGRY